ncbi:MAG: hypothetical protein M3T55_08425 [Pseudomonadota bacterium]|nr:hypothetical protein [Pseudomonadota bacterium]
MTAPVTLVRGKPLQGRDARRKVAAGSKATMPKILGRNSFERPKAAGLKMLDAVMDIYEGRTGTKAGGPGS